MLRAQNQVVLKTAPGHASSVAVALDNEEWPEVVGTIAGDDTILVITPDDPTAEASRRSFWRCSKTTNASARGWQEDRGARAAEGASHGVAPFFFSSLERKAGHAAFPG